MVLVMAIVSALAVIGTTAVQNSAATFRLDSAAAKLISDIRLAREMAMTYNIWYGITFAATPTDQYQVYSTDGSTDTIISDPSNPQNSLSILIQSEFSGVSMTSVTFDGGNKLEFNPDGVPYLDYNGLTLSAVGNIVLASGSKNKLVTVQPITGALKIQ